MTQPPLPVHEFGALQGLPQLPEVDACTRALFVAIEARSLADVQAALKNGAKLDAVEPFRSTDGQAIEGGMDPLQTVCASYPGGLIDLPILAALLHAGADVHRMAVEADGVGILERLAQALPRNGAHAAEILIAAGARPSAKVVEFGLFAEKSWLEDTESRFFVPLMDTLWKAMPAEEQAKVDMQSFLKDIVSNHALTAEQARRAKWVLEHAAVPAPHCGGRLAEKRAEVPVRDFEPGHLEEPVPARNRLN